PFLFVGISRPVHSRTGPDEIRLAGGAEIVGRRFARTAVGHDLVGDLLAFAQRSQAGAFDGADVHEHVIAAVVRLNEAVALGCVKPLHGSHAHGGSPFSDILVVTHDWWAGEIEFLEGSSASEPGKPVDSSSSGRKSIGGYYAKTGKKTILRA